MAVRGGGGQNTITDCVIYKIHREKYKLHREFKLEKGVGTMT